MKSSEPIRASSYSFGARAFSPFSASFLTISVFSARPKRHRPVVIARLLCHPNRSESLPRCREVARQQTWTLLVRRLHQRCLLHRKAPPAPYSAPLACTPLRNIRFRFCRYKHTSLTPSQMCSPMFACRRRKNLKKPDLRVRQYLMRSMVQSLHTRGATNTQWQP